MFRSFAALVVVADAARIDQHLNIQSNLTGDNGGLIKVMDGSKCLAVYGGNINAADKVTIFAENCKPGAAHQTWKHEKGALKNVAAPGKCLDIFENKCSNGQDLVLWPCNGQRNQQFQFIGKNLKSSKCSKCLDVDMASNIKNVLLWNCGVGKQNQKMDWAAEFSLAEQDAVEETEVETSEAEEMGLHFESNTTGAASPRVWTGTIKGYRGLCVDIYSPGGMSEGTRTVGTNIVTWPCHGGQNQQWFFQDGQIKNVASGMCLDIFENKCKNDQNLIAWTCNGQKNQQWIVGGDGQIKSKKCSKCVDIDLKSNSKHPDLYNLLIWKCKSTADKVNQQWSVGGR